MASIVVGGKEFQIADRQAPGGLARAKKHAETMVKIGEAKGLEVFDLLAERIANYLLEPDLPFLIANLPEDCSGILRECIVGSGGKLAEPGEAKSQ